MAPTIYEVAKYSDTVIVSKHASAPFAQWPSDPEVEGAIADAPDASPAELGPACAERKEPPAESTSQDSCEFKHVFGKGGWNESRAVDGRYRVVAEDWDEDALLTVLNIIHLRNKHVPGAISLEHLAMVGVIDDYYEFGEAIEMFTALWLQNIRRQCIPSEYCRELILWIWVPFVFDMPAGFEKATLAAVYFATEAVQVLGLPIPKTVAD
ncbi:hypothetical protein E8E11_010869 [Didymella keratinophila]|nr:hypothetical protein E8E11_010869 [Didymella keratinophila]